MLISNKQQITKCLQICSIQFICRSESISHYSLMTQLLDPHAIPSNMYLNCNFTCPQLPSVPPAYGRSLPRPPYPQPPPQPRPTLASLPFLPTPPCRANGFSIWCYKPSSVPKPMDICHIERNSQHKSLQSFQHTQLFGCHCQLPQMEYKHAENSQ